jgi:hypothetical protein
LEDKSTESIWGIHGHQLPHSHPETSRSFFGRLRDEGLEFRDDSAFCLSLDTIRERSKHVAPLAYPPASFCCAHSKPWQMLAQNTDQETDKGHGSRMAGEGAGMVNETEDGADLARRSQVKYLAVNTEFSQLMELQCHFLTGSLVQAPASSLAPVG